MSRSKNFTVRLSDDDQQVLDNLAGIFEADRSATVRRALRIALRSESALTGTGIFKPINTPQTSFAVRLLPGEQNDG